MTRISLDGDWKLTCFREGECAVCHPDELAGAGRDAIPARVPGNVELDLERAGIIGDPFFADNMLKLRPFEFYEWWYTRDIDVAESAGAGPWRLVFAGLDTVATVWVNGVEVGRADNMLIEHRFDVTDALRPGGANRICVRIGSPIRQAQRYRYDATVKSWETREEGVYMRKAPHMWGWDIMPRAVSAGIWRPVWLESVDGDAIEQLYFWTASASADGAALGVHFQVRTERFGGEQDLSLRFRGECGDHAFEHEVPIDFVAGNAVIHVPGARLWWPKGYGEPNLYDVTVALCAGGEVLAWRCERIGLRTVQVDRT
ncbi:MAG: hypothetical protein JXR94_08250, partial [Candidatus Hydrogenedentes bacterium]|nr:hypothetical protein [Candidatus Hydrogenedentota bacterium]